MPRKYTRRTAAAVDIFDPPTDAISLPDHAINDIIVDTQPEEIDRENPLHWGAVQLPDTKGITPTPVSEPMPELFKRHTINLLFGSSMSGKTTLLLSQLDSYYESGRFLTSELPDAISPDQCGLINCMGTVHDIRAKIEELELSNLTDPRKFPVLSWRRTQGDVTPREALERMLDEMNEVTAHPVTFLVIDGLQVFMQGGKGPSSDDIREFYGQLEDFCLDSGVTILGTGDEAKRLSGQYYMQLADRPKGDTAWSQGAKTLIGISKMELDRKEEIRTERRRVVMESKIYGSYKPFVMAFDTNNRLAIIDEVVPAKDQSAHDKLTERLLGERDGAVFTRDTFLRWGAAIDVGASCVGAWLGNQCEPIRGLLERQGSSTRKRVYVKRDPLNPEDIVVDTTRQKKK